MRNDRIKHDQFVNSISTEKRKFQARKMIGSIIVIVLMGALVCLFIFLKRRYQFWKNRRVPYLEPESITHGNYGDFFRGKVSSAEHVMKIYNELAPHKFGGIFAFQQPVLFVRDPGIIKRILVTDFDHFCDRSPPSLGGERDPSSMDLFSLTGDDWRTLRQKLKPMFYSDKMKSMFELMSECVEKLERAIEEHDFVHDPINVKNYMEKYTTDVLISCTFGFDVEKLSEFQAMWKMMVTPSWSRRVRNVFFSISPSFVHSIGFAEYSRRMYDFFVDLVRSTVEHRKKNQIKKNDFLNALMNIQTREEEARNSDKRKKDEETSSDIDFNIELIATQCFVFYVAEFEMSSNALSHILYQLAEHQGIQRNLRNEVDRVLKKYDGKITYDALQDMHYMAKVINETSRLFPAITVLARICTEDYRFRDFQMKEGEMVLIPVHALHRDPQYFPNPDDFNPENFSEKMKKSRPACCFLPFGEGPRDCIGMRFCVQQIKLALTMIMSKYTLTVSPNMKFPLELKPHTILTVLKNEILLDVNKRDKLDVKKK